VCDWGLTLTVRCPEDKGTSCIDRITLPIPHTWTRSATDLADVAGNPAELWAWCRERLASYKVPAAVEFRSELPKSMVGKVLRRMLTESHPS